MPRGGRWRAAVRRVLFRAAPGDAARTPVRARLCTAVHTCGCAHTRLCVRGCARVCERGVGGLGQRAHRRPWTHGGRVRVRAWVLGARVHGHLCGREWPPTDERARRGPVAARTLTARARVCVCVRVCIRAGVWVRERPVAGLSAPASPASGLWPLDLERPLSGAGSGLHVCVSLLVCVRAGVQACLCLCVCVCVWLLNDGQPRLTRKRLETTGPRATRAHWPTNVAGGSALECASVRRCPWACACAPGPSLQALLLLARSGPVATDPRAAFAAGGGLGGCDCACGCVCVCTRVCVRAVVGRPRATRDHWAASGPWRDWWRPVCVCVCAPARARVGVWAWVRACGYCSLPPAARNRWPSSSS